MQAIVIGGGPAGLVAANQLADQGVGVTVLERRARPGGRAASDVQDGFILNQGPHALYLGGAGTRELKRLGIDLSGGAPALQAPVVEWEGELHPLPFGPGSLVRSRLLGPRGKLAFGKWFASVMLPGSDELATRSAAAWLADEIGDEGARRLAMAATRVATYTADLHRISADVARSQLRIADRPGVRYLDGGWQALVDRLAARARGAGATITTSSRVDAVTGEPGRWRVVTGDGELEADAVIVASGGPERARRLLAGVADTSHWRVGPAAHASVLDLGLRELPVDAHRFATSVDGPLYFSVHSPPAKVAVQGVLVAVAAYVPADDSEAGSRERLEAFADRVQPGWRELVLTTRHLPGMTVISALPAPEHGGLAGRPQPAVPGAPGLFVAGDWVGPEGLLVDGAISSAVQAARQAVSARQAVPA